MPSVWTQTPWSWLQDLARISTLGGGCSPEEEELEKGCLPSENDTDAHVNDASVEGNVTECNSEGRNDQADCYHQNDKHAPGTASPSQQPDGKVDTVHILPKLVPVAEERTNHMPPVACDSVLKLPHLITTQLQEIDFHGSDQESLSSTDGGEESDTDTSHRERQQGFPDLQVSSLPWPTILQYLRESESLASEYFSLKNKHPVAVERLGVHEEHPEKEEKGEWTTKDTQAKVLLQGSDSNTCEFCGQQSPRFSLLSSGTEEEGEGVPAFCCEEYKEFCLLVAACMRQMVERREQEQPAKIEVKREKTTIRKTAEQRALAMMCRKNKWEQLRKKRLKQLQSSSFYSLTKQTKTIQFSLLSPSITTTEWMVRPESHSSSDTSCPHRPPRGRRREKKRGERKRITDTEVLPPEVIERLKQNAPPFRDLEIRKYCGGQLFASLLPDGTGQCYYPSGNIAVLVFAPYSGVLAYLVYEDSDHSRMLAYLDELGRVCCYNTDGRIRLLITPSTGMQFDQQGHVKKKWVWQDRNALPQPLTLTPTRHISIRCNSQGTMSLVFSAQQQHIKFCITAKIKADYWINARHTANMEAAESDLQKTQTRVRHLLDSLQHSNRVQKLAELRSVYAPKRGGAAAPHRRSKSMEAQALQKPFVKQMT